MDDGWKRPLTTTVYDPDGNAETVTDAEGRITHNVFDFLNRLKTTRDHANITVAYRTRRVRRADRDGTGEWNSAQVIFSGGTSVAEVGERAVEYVRGSDWGGGVGGILYTLRDATLRFNHYDGRGDVVLQTDGAGALTWRASYEAYGTRTMETGSNADRQRGNTKEEGAAGLLDEGMRYRDLTTGTFLTPDPAGFVDGPNLYAYVRQNPWSKFDPEGLACYVDLRSLPNCSPEVRSALDEHDRQTARDVGPATAVFGNLVGGFVPGVSQIQGALTLRDPEASKMEKFLAGVGMIPEVGGVVKGIGILAKGAKNVSKIEKCAAEVVKETGQVAKNMQKGEKGVAKIAEEESGKIGSTRHVELEPAENGAYTVEFESGKTYDGKGGTDRARRSARERSRENNDSVKDITHNPAGNDSDAFKMEAENLEKHGGPSSPNNYNQRNSPGRKLD